MAATLTLSGVGDAPPRDCRCVINPRTKRGVKVCKVPKSKKHRSGTVFAGKCDSGSSDTVLNGSKKRKK